MLDKQRQQQESKFMDEIDALQGRYDRCQKEADKFKRKYNDAMDSTSKLLSDMDNYQKILETLESNVK